MPENLQDITLAPVKASSPDTITSCKSGPGPDFDPSKAELIDIARAVEAGTAFVTAIEFPG